MLIKKYVTFVLDLEIHFHLDIEGSFSVDQCQQIHSNNYTLISCCKTIKQELFIDAVSNFVKDRIIKS